jgi:hypothetical protein
MTTIEDRLRAAATAAAGTVAPGSAPPLRLPAEPGRRSGPGRRGARQNWTRWMAPLAAAAAVVAVVAASLAVAGGAPGHRPQPRAVHTSPLASLPPYYVMLTGNNPDPTVLQPLHAVIRATATGATVATIAAPSPYSTFDSVAGAGDGHTFVLAAEKLVVDHVDGGVSQQAAPVKFFVLRISPAGRASLTALPIPREPASVGLAGMALSPDGRELAVAVGGPRIQVFTTATGAERDWTWPGGGRITNNAGGEGQVLSWTADDRTLAFQLWRGRNIYVGLADTAGAGGGRGPGRLVVNFAGQAVDSAHGTYVLNGPSALITPNGAAIVCAASTAMRSTHGAIIGYKLGYVAFSTRTGRPLEVLDPRQYTSYKWLQTEDVLWTNASGSELIVVANVPAAKPGKYRLQIGALGAHGFTPLPGEQLASELFSAPVW